MATLYGIDSLPVVKVHSRRVITIQAVRFKGAHYGNMELFMSLVVPMAANV